MKTENFETVLGHIMNASFMASLPDFKNQSLWEEAVKRNHEHPILPYFKQITDGIPGIKNLLEDLKQGC